MKKYLSIILFILFIAPSVVSAAWWNPLDWFNKWTFSKTPTPPVVEEIQKIPEEKNIEEEKVAEPTPTPIVQPKPIPTSTRTPIPTPTPIPKVPSKPTEQNITPNKNTRQELNDLYAVFKDILENNKNDIESLYETGKKITSYPTSYKSEITSALKGIDSLIQDMYEFGREVITEAEKVNKAQYADMGYWKTTGIPNMLIKQKGFKERGLKIMNNFIEDIDDKRAEEKSNYSSQNNYYDACDEIEQELRSIPGGGTESQIQAMLRAKGC